jgi:hypothetical protein
MRKPLLISLLSLAVGLGGCQDDSAEPPAPEPEPALAGKWPMYSFTYLEYDSLGRQTNQSLEYAFPDRGNYLAVTDSTMQKHNADGTPYTALRHYTRTGNVLTYRGRPTNWTYTITLLTATELRILEKTPQRRNGQFYYYAEEHRYRRPE